MDAWQLKSLPLILRTLMDAFFFLLKGSAPLAASSLSAGALDPNYAEVLEEKETAASLPSLSSLQLYPHVPPLAWTKCLYPYWSPGVY